jgi:hypothetical protein
MSTKLNVMIQWYKHPDDAAMPSKSKQTSLQDTFTYVPVPALPPVPPCPPRPQVTELDVNSLPDLDAVNVLHELAVDLHELAAVVEAAAVKSFLELAAENLAA